MRMTSASADRRAVLSALAAGGAALACRPAAAAERPASPWARGMHSRMRLSAAGRAAADGPIVAVVELSLDRGFKTYWRTPGDSGVPPSFDFAGSDNVRDVAVHFPPPRRFDDGAGGQSIGYPGPLVELPVTFRPVDPGKASRLRLSLDYAVCEKICVPASGQAELRIEPKAAASADAARLLAGLPAKQPLGAPGPLSVLALGRAGEAESFIAEAALPAGEPSDLFVEAASPWLFDAKPLDAARAAAGRSGFRVVAIDRDRAPDCKGVEVTMTLVSGARAVETTAWLDVSLLTP